jgi:hypothetical protein
MDESDIFQQKFARKVWVSDYWNALHRGQKLFGRTIYLEEKDDEQVQMTFIRFKNKPSNKYIGFNLTASKDEIFLKMLQSVINFTI